MQKITFGQLKSSNKILIHIDFNSYFASVEQQANPFLRNKAIAITGKSKYSIDIKDLSEKVDIEKVKLNRTVITTASSEAKKLGIKTAMSSIEALRLCPELKVIPGDPKKYEYITNRFLNILREYSDKVEKFSNDEAFVDITDIAGDYFGAIIIAEGIRNKIKSEIGENCSVSIGIANNKTLAKLASEYKKPNGLTLVKSEEAINFIDKCKLSDICGIGLKVEDRLNKLGIYNFAQLRDFPLDELFHEFKSYAFFLHNIAYGLGEDRINNEIEVKSIGNSYTFCEDINDDIELRKQALAICDKVAFRLRKKGMVAYGISFYIRYANFGGSMKKSIKLKEPVDDGLYLLNIIWPYIKDSKRSIRLFGVSVNNLVIGIGNTSIISKDEKVKKLWLVLDQIMNKFGNNILSRLNTVNTNFKGRVSGWHYD